MKKLFLLLILVSSPLWADARKYSYSDPKLNDELDNVYHDLLYLKAVNVTASTGTFTQLNVSSISITGSVTGLSLTGVTDGSSAAAGKVGEYISSFQSTTNYPASATSADLTTIILTAGDWDISAVTYTTANGASVTSVLAGIGTVTGDDLTGVVFGDSGVAGGVVSAANALGLSIPSSRVSITGSATYRLKFRANYTVATPQAAGRISARRIR